MDPNLSQHFLIDPAVVDFLVGQIPKKSSVLEIGAGSGTITEKLAQKTAKVTAVEIDKRFSPDLSAVKNRHKNIEIIFGNVLDLDFSADKNLWLTGNIPFHIVEPLLLKTALSPLAGAVFLAGVNLAAEINARIENPHFGKLTILVNTFFRAEILKRVRRESFSPVPKTDVVVVKLTPRKRREFLVDPVLFVFRELFLSAKHSPQIKNALREIIIRSEKRRNKKVLTKNAARTEVENLNLPAGVLAKSFEQLNNDELCLLFGAVKMVS